MIVNFGYFENSLPKHIGSHCVSIDFNSRAIANATKIAAWKIMNIRQPVYFYNVLYQGAY